MPYCVQPWHGARNFSDLGGFPTRDGGRTAFGRVWRSAAREWMTGSGWYQARLEGLARVIDLRNDMERRRLSYHPVVDESAWWVIDIVSAPTEDPHDPEFLAECGPWLDHPRSWRPNAERYPAKFATVFNAIADTPGPLLIHCAGGRDRTGMIVSMLLALNGVQPDAIADAYERGFRGAADEVHEGGLAFDPASGEWRAADEEWEDIDEAIAERKLALRQWLQEVDIRSYLRGAGVDDDRLKRLESLLRE